MRQIVSKGKYNTYALDKNSTLTLNLDTGFKVTTYFLPADTLSIEYKSDRATWYWTYSLNKWCWTDGVRKKRLISNMVGTNYLLLAGWCLVKTSMIHSFASEISTTFSYSNMTILHSAACFLYKFLLEVSASFLKYCFRNRWCSGTKVGIRMHWVHYYINLHYKTLVWR